LTSGPQSPAPAESAPATTRAAEVVSTIIIVALVVGFVASRPIRRRFAAHPSTEQCAALLDRYVEHLAHAADPRAAASAIEEQRARTRALAAKDPDFGRCSQTITRDEADCAMKAQNADEFERCLP
jgi:hypothetical protein